MDYSDLGDYGEAYWLERQYEAYQAQQQRELLAMVTTPEEDAAALLEAQHMADVAEADESYMNRCLAGEKVFYYSYPKALIPGHIYSMAGRDEFYISGSCEYHFDLWMREPEDEEQFEADWGIKQTGGENVLWDSVWRD